MAEKRPADAEEPPSKRARLEETTLNAENEQEKVVGITAFTSPSTPGFRCTVKQRYTDFLVNEIPPTGQVLHLTELPETKQRRRNDNHPPEANGSRNAPSIKDESAHQEPVLAKPIKDDPELVTNGGAAKPKPKDDKPEDVKREDVKQEEDEAVPASELSSEDGRTLHDVFGETTTNQIMTLYALVLKHPYRKPRDHPPIKSEVISDKSMRTAAHVAIRRIFNSKLQTETLQDEVGVIAIKAAPSRLAQGGRGQPSNTDSNGAITKGKLGWSELGGEYLHFTLYKENKDTMEVLYFIASQLKIPAKNFQFAGTKDRRGVTVQKVAIFRVHSNRVAGVNKMAKGWVASGFEYKPHGLDLGDLMGNEFLLTLRDCHFNGEDGLEHGKKLELAKRLVSQAAENFKTRGFLNYYGLQRFGTFSTGTHVVGMKILQGDLEGAVNSILTYSPDLLPENQQVDGTSKVPQDDINRADAIRSWQEGKLTGHDISNRLPRRFQAESAIMQYLGKKDRSGRLVQEKDWQGALMQIQRNLRLMYVHAYQSLVWNTVAGKRWGLYGEKVVEGDLVIIGEKDGDVGSRVKEEVDEDGEPIVRPAADDSAPSASEDFTRARHLSKAEAESGKYDIFDIVLPLPGFDVVYPANAVGKFYEEFMSSEAGGKLDPHNMRRAWKDASLSGDYRKMMARPLQGLVEWEVKEYGGEEEQMVETDLEKLRKVKAESSADGTQATGGVANGDAEMKVEGNGLEDGERKEKARRLAVVIKFQLGSSQYATMALRELTKGGAVPYKPDFSVAR